MRGMAKITVGLALLAATPAMARAPLGAGPLIAATNYPGAPRPVYNDGNTSPYAVTYADEAAQTLGLRDGHMDVFTSQPGRNPSEPSFSGGLGGEGAVFKLQW